MNLKSKQMNKGKLIDADKLKEKLRAINKIVYINVSVVSDIIDELSEEREEKPNPLKVAIKGDGTKEYSKVIFQYFSSHTIKGLHDVDSFEQEDYYFIENNELVFSLNLPEGYTEITLKDEEKESNYCTCGNKSNCSSNNGLISVCYDCRKPIKEDRPTGLIPELEKRVEVIEQKLKDLSNG